VKRDGRLGCLSSVFPDEQSLSDAHELMHSFVHHFFVAAGGDTDAAADVAAVAGVVGGGNGNGNDTAAAAAQNGNGFGNGNGGVGDTGVVELTGVSCLRRARPVATVPRAALFR
jgi:hypothetical protein